MSMWLRPWYWAGVLLALTAACAVGPVTACIQPLFLSVCAELGPREPEESAYSAVAEPPGPEVIEEPPAHMMDHWVPDMPTFDPLERNLPKPGRVET